jgi:hypothetical protein
MDIEVYGLALSLSTRYSLLSSGLCTAFDIARPGSLQAGGRDPVLLHPHEHHCKALLQGGVEIAPRKLVTLRLIVQRVGATGVAGGA